MNLSLGVGLGSSAIGGASDPILAIFADGTDGFYFDFSKTNRLFQSSVNNTPANDAGENICLAFDAHGWAGREIAAEVLYLTDQITNGDNEATLMTTAYGSVTASNGTVARSSDQAYAGTYSAKYLCNTASSTTHYISVGTVPANTALRIAGRVYLPTGSLGKVAIVDISDGSVIYTIASAAKDQWVEFAFTRGPKSGSWPLAFGNNAAESVNGQAFYLDDLSIKEIPGNHGLQATTAAQPKWQTGGLARFDGSDDCLPTPLVPGSAMTLMAKCLFSVNNSKVIMGCQDATSGRCQLIFSSLQSLSAGVGSQDSTTIFASTNISNSIHVVALKFDGSTVKLYIDGVEEYSGAQSGSPSASVPITVGARNVAGTNGVFFDKDIYHALAIKKALTAAEIAAITNLWGTL